MSPKRVNDVLVIGAGHNGLITALRLARAGLSVRVLEAKPVIGGAARTEKPFARAPGLSQSTGAYLVGLVPPELLARLEIKLPLLRRRPHYFLPTTGDRYLLLGGPPDATRAQFERFFDPADWKANEALQQELEALREDVGPSWLQEPDTIEDTAERWVRPALREVFVDLCRGSVGAYLERFDFRSDLLKAMYAVTDGFTGLYGGWDTPGTGMNFLIHSMCRLPGADGTWLIPQGGMGTVTQTLADAARAAGVAIETEVPVQTLEVEAGSVRAAVTERGERYEAQVIAVNADPFRLQAMLPDDALPSSLRDRIAAFRRDGTTMKVNLALDGLPEFRCLPEDRGQHRGTIHLLPDEDQVLSTLRKSFAEVEGGRLPDFPTIEWYIHTPVDPSLSDAQGRHSSALFVQWVPYALCGTDWSAEESRYVEHLLSICDRFAPGTTERVADTFVLTPPKIEEHFGLTRGHIHHVDNSFGFADRMPHATGVDGLYCCGAGCHPGGSVIGAAGYNAATRILTDLAARP